MNSDIRTVVWKEYREMFSGPAARDNIAVTAIMLGMMGILMPLQQGAAFVTSSLTLGYSYIVPFTIILNLIADSFAGERERHTLETLLAGRLSDRAILFGKLLATVLYAWGVAITCLLLGLISVNVAAAGGGHLLLPPAWLALSFVTLSLLVSWLFAGLGVLISLRSPTVRQAQQIVGLMISVPMMPVLAVALMMKNQEFAALVMRVVSRVSLMLSNVTALTGTMMLVLLVIDLALVRISLARFQRARLILD